MATKRLVPTPIKTIRLKCLDCCCGSTKEVRLCPSLDCPNWPYRLRKRPTPEMKEQYLKFQENTN